MYKIHNLEEYNEVMRLRNTFGWGSTKISYYLSNNDILIKERTIDSWLHENNKPFEEKLITKIPEESKLLNNHKAYILGVLCGDGYTSTNHRVGLSVCDFDFIQEFKKCIKLVYNLDLKIKKRIVKNSRFKSTKPIYCGVIVSKRAWLDILRYDSFKTKTWIVPKEILDSSGLNIKSNFLKGIFDSEGTIRLKKKGHGYLQTCSGNNSSLLVIQDMLLRDFNIKMRVRYNNVGVMVLYTERYEDINNFSNKIGFVIDRKQKMLKYVLSTYKRKGLRRYNKEFKDKALKMLDQGYSASQIGKILNFNRTNVYDFIKQANRDS
ncbi:MAG: LAGLIDADG family homing endonuclease [archaeon]